MLSALILIPLLGAAIVGFSPEEKNSKQSRNLAIIAAISIINPGMPRRSGRSLGSLFSCGTL